MLQMQRQGQPEISLAIVKANSFGAPTPSKEVRGTLETLASDSFGDGADGPRWQNLTKNVTRAHPSPAVQRSEPFYAALVCRIILYRDVKGHRYFR
jgi:hypothetical protein